MKNILNKMKSFILNFYSENKKFILDKNFIISSIVGILFLEFSYLFTKEMAIIATYNAGYPSNDFFHSLLPRTDTSFIHGTLSFWLFDLRYFVFFIFLRFLPFATKALALIIITRALILNLTNLGMPADIIPIVSNITFGGDLFFSGHVANTFTLGLIFWNIKFLRYLFITFSIVFGISAVLGHYHYSIDVISAPFFAFGIFHISKKLFSNDYQYLNK